ncbi:hypothetical protein Peur_007763 [Populus x canadensis]
MPQRLVLCCPEKNMGPTPHTWTEGKEGELKAALKSEALISYYCPKKVGPKRHMGVKPRLVIIKVDAHFGLCYHPREVGLGCHRDV